MDKATFTLLESAFSGADDPRRAVVELAVDAANRHPEAVVGNTIYWHLIPAAERSTWSSQIVGGQNGFTDSETVVAIRTALLGAQQTAAAEIEAESRKVVKQIHRRLLPHVPLAEKPIHQDSLLDQITRKCRHSGDVKQRTVAMYECRMARDIDEFCTSDK